MVSVNFNRPPRIQHLSLPSEEIDLPAPPDVSSASQPGWIVSVLPVMGIAVMAAFYLFRGGGNFVIPMFALALFTISGTIFAHRWRKKDHEKRHYESILSYIRVLDRKRARLQAAHNAQIAILEANFPKPQDALKLALSRDTRLWERRYDDPDFATFRLGTGRIPSQVKITTPDPDNDNEEIERAFQLADTYRFLHNAPVALPLRTNFSIGMSGKHSIVLQSARSIICQLAITHAPQDLHIYLIAPQAHQEHWRWIEWLPHVSYSHQGGTADFVAFSADSVRNLLGSLSQIIDERQGRKTERHLPHIMIVIDSPHLAESEAVFTTVLRNGNQVGASALCLVNRYEAIPGDCNSIIQIDDTGQFHYAQIGPHGNEIRGDGVDQLWFQDAEHIARALSSVIMRESGSGGRIPRTVDFLDLYGVQNADGLHTKIAERWLRPIPDGILPHPVPIGRESLALDTYILLDEEHHGPHGVLAGTTGSGKSGLLQALICAMAVEHDPRLLSFLLIDFKGGSTFNIFADLPHTVGEVTNLDVVRVERALAALKAETQYRQQFLKRMNVGDITQYHRFFARTAAHIQDPSYHPLPHLLIVVDEFTQLAKEMPEFMTELVRTVQVGRSLGLHLILGTQSPMDVITDEMNANLQFRICLRVQNIEASRAMLRRPDAAYLPAGWPGRGYFQVGEQGVFKQFQAAYVGGDYRPANDNEPVILDLITDDGQAINLLPENYHTPTIKHLLATEPHTIAHAVTETIVAYSKTQNIAEVPAILLPPLEEQITLSTAFSKLDVGGWDGQRWQPSGYHQRGNWVRLGSAPVGLLDDVHNRTQDPLWIHLNTGDHEHGDYKDGHVLIMGGPGTGKTTFLQSLAISQALLHPPDHLHMYFLSFTGGGLNEVSRLPHAENVIYGTESERVRRLFGRLIHTLNARQSGDVDGFQSTIMLCIDQYEQFRDTYFESHMKDFERLIHEGRAVGIYLVITASSITAVPDRLRSLIQQRIAFQLGNATDYLMAVGHINIKVDRTLPRGRGYIYGSPPLTCQISLPCKTPSVVDDADVRAAMTDLIDDMQTSYEAINNKLQSPAPLEALPTRLPLTTLPLPIHQESPHVITPLGRSDDDSLSVFELNWWERGVHFIVTGPPGSGKTNLLQAAVLSAAQQYSPDNLRFLLVDFNGRSLRSLDSLKHVIWRATDTIDLQAQLLHLQSELDSFTNILNAPKTVLIIDDYDATSEALGSNPALLRQLRDHIRLHSDFGLHIWVAGYLERIGDPLIKQLLLRRSGFGLMHRDSLHNLNVRTMDLPAEPMPTGRAFFAQQHSIQIIQTAIVENPSKLVKRINKQIWPEHERAAWNNLSTQKDTPKQVEAVSTENDDDTSLDIDTAGLIEDLLGGE